MKKILRSLTLLLAVLCASSAFAEEITQMCGVFKVMNSSTRNYVRVYKKYYAKPDATEDQATDLTIGIGAKVTAKGVDGTTPEDTYRIYQLAGDYDGGTANVFDYIDKAISWAIGLGQDKVREKLDDEVTIDWEFLEGDSYTFKAGDHFTFKKGDKFTFKAGDTYNGETLTEDKEVTFDEDYTYTFEEDYTYTFTQTRTISITVTLRELLEKITEQTFDKELKDSHIDKILADFEQLVNAYGDGYSYFAYQPLGSQGYNSVGTLALTFPKVPAAADFAARGMTKDHVDAWTWAKRFLIAKLKERGSDSDLQNLVKNNIDKIEPGKTYYLTADSENTFDFSETATDVSAIWVLWYQSGNADNLQPGDYFIQNKATEKVVRVYSDQKYKAEPELTMDEAKKNKEESVVTLELGRCDRNDGNLYMVSKLENGEQDVVNYIHKGVWKARDIIVEKVDNHKTKFQELLDSLNSTSKKALFKNDEDMFVAYTYDDLKNDLDLAVEVCERAYAYMYVHDNGDGTVGLSVTTPKIPWILEKLYQWYKGADNSVWDWAMDQVKDYFTKNPKGGLTGEFVERNLKKTAADKTYYLLAEDNNTFDFGENNSTDYAKWILKDANADSLYVIEDGTTYDLNNGGSYDVTVADALVVAKVVVGEVEGEYACAFIVAKDDNNYRKDKNNVMNEKWIDYVTLNKFGDGNWDNSNWVILNILELYKNGTITNPTEEFPVGSVLKAETVKGTYFCNAPYTINLTQKPLIDSTSTLTFSANHYVIPNFNAAYYGGYAYNSDSTFYFHEPHTGEICVLHYAEWDAESKGFTTPEKSDTTNQYNFSGSVGVNFEINTTDEGFGKAPELEDGAQYNNIEALYVPDLSLVMENRTPEEAPRRASAANSAGGTAYPTGFTGEGDQKPTAITDITVDHGTVKAVRYFNIMGVESAEPTEGVNIIVTEYSDGTRNAVKVIK